MAKRQTKKRRAPAREPDDDQGRLAVMRAAKRRIAARRKQLETVEDQIIELQRDRKDLRKSIADDEKLVIRAVDEPVQLVLLGDGPTATTAAMA